MNLYPQKSSGAFKINITNLMGEGVQLKLNILSADGLELAIFNLEDQICNIDLTTFSEGVYFYFVHSNQKAVLSKGEVSIVKS